MCLLCGSHRKEFALNSIAAHADGHSRLVRALTLSRVERPERLATVIDEALVAAAIAEAL